MAPKRTRIINYAWLTLLRRSKTEKLSLGLKYELPLRCAESLKHDKIETTFL